MSSEPEVNHLRTYFLFLVAIDRAALIEEHPEIWRGSQPWFERLDHWITGHVVPEYASAATQLGGWQRHPESIGTQRQYLVVHRPSKIRRFAESCISYRVEIRKCGDAQR